MEILNHKVHSRMGLISHLNIYVRDKINACAGHYEPLLSMVKCQNTWLDWIRHVTHHDTISKIILKWTVRDKWKRRKQRKSSTDNIKERAGCRISTHDAGDREWWLTLITDNSIITPQRPWLGFWDEMMQPSPSPHITHVSNYLLICVSLTLLLLPCEFRRRRKGFIIMLSSGFLRCMSYH